MKKLFILFAFTVLLSNDSEIVIDSEYYKLFPSNSSRVESVDFFNVNHERKEIVATFNWEYVRSIVKVKKYV